jgi:DNA-binding transcriptional regulator YiaG
MSREEARAILLDVGQPPALVLQALRAELKLSDFVLSGVVGKSAQTVRRWRRAQPGVDVPDGAASAIDDLRAITAMLLRAGFEATTIKSFLLSRNTGLGQDRPLDGLRPGMGAFRRVEHVTECFVAGVAPEPGPALRTHDGEEREPASARSPVARDSSHQPVAARR